jgi:hypothetical protein
LGEDRRGAAKVKGKRERARPREGWAGIVSLWVLIVRDVLKPVGVSRLGPWSCVDVRTRYVLREKLPADRLAFIPTTSNRVPYCPYHEVGVVTGPHQGVLHNALAEYGAIDEEIEVEVRYRGGVVRWVSEVDKSLYGNRRGGSVNDREVANFGRQTTDTRCSVSSFPASDRWWAKVSKICGEVLKKRFTN